MVPNPEGGLPKKHQFIDLWRVCHSLLSLQRAYHLAVQVRQIAANIEEDKQRSSQQIAAFPGDVGIIPLLVEVNSLDLMNHLDPTLFTIGTSPGYTPLSRTQRPSRPRTSSTSSRTRRSSRTISVILDTPQHFENVLPTRRARRQRTSSSPP